MIEQDFNWLFKTYEKIYSANEIEVGKMSNDYYSYAKGSLLGKSPDTNDYKTLATVKIIDNITTSNVEYQITYFNEKLMFNRALDGYLLALKDEVYEKLKTEMDRQVILYKGVVRHDENYVQITVDENIVFNYIENSFEDLVPVALSVISDLRYNAESGWYIDTLIGEQDPKKVIFQSYYHYLQLRAAVVKDSLPTIIALNIFEFLNLVEANGWTLNETGFFASANKVVENALS